MFVRRKGTDLQLLHSAAAVNRCRVVTGKDRGVRRLAERGEHRPDGPQGSLPTQWAAIRVSMRLTIGGSWGGRSSVAMIFVSSSIRMKAFSRFILNGDGDLEASRTAMQLLLRAAALTRNGI